MSQSTGSANLGFASNEGSSKYVFLPYPSPEGKGLGWATCAAAWNWTLDLTIISGLTTLVEHLENVCGFCHHTGSGTAFPMTQLVQFVSNQSGKFDGVSVSSTHGMRLLMTRAEVGDMYLLCIVSMTMKANIGALPQTKLVRRKRRLISLLEVSFQYCQSLFCA